MRHGGWGLGGGVVWPLSFCSHNDFECFFSHECCCVLRSFFVHAVVCPEMLHVCWQAAQKRRNRFIGLFAALANTLQKPCGGTKCQLGFVPVSKDLGQLLSQTACGCVMYTVGAFVSVSRERVRWRGGRKKRRAKWQ